MIDKTSFKIMNELRKDGRATNVEIARKLGINVATVAKKINSIIEKGMIVINAMPDPVFMGYRVKALIGIEAEPKQIDAVCNFLQKDSHVHMVSSCLGRFDILAIVFFENIGFLQKYLKNDLPQINGINHFEVFFISDYKRNFTLNEDSLGTERIPVLDNLDKEIIAELIHDGRPNYADMAEKLQTSKPTISRRITNLLKDKIIQIIAIPNSSKIGFTANAYVLIKVQSAMIEEICEKLNTFQEIHIIMRVMQEFDIFLGIYSFNLDTLYKFLHTTIGNMNGIIKIETFICGEFFYLKHCKLK